MLITIKYFGQIAEITQLEEESLEVLGTRISELILVLHQKYPELKNKNFKIAQHQQLVSTETILTGKEIALLPPFAGG